MLRSVLCALAVAGCHHPQPAEVHADRRCPNVEITRPHCAPPSAEPKECRGVCGVVVTGNCRPVRDALLRVGQAVASTDENGRFELSALPAGHYRVVMSIGPETGEVELDVRGTPETLPEPFGVPLIENQGCGCGGPCPT